MIANFLRKAAILIQVLLFIFLCLPNGFAAIVSSYHERYVVIDVEPIPVPPYSSYKEKKITYRD